jgi:hypothetical protein
MDFSGAQTLMGTFKTILQNLKMAGGWDPGLHVKIDNPLYMELVIEAMDVSGPMGLPAISVCHCASPLVFADLPEHLPRLTTGQSAH